jgi:hypothetical protein
MKPYFAMMLFATTAFGQSAADTSKVGPTLCVTYRMYINTQSIPLPAGYDRMMTEKLSTMGYRPAACSTAQIQLAIEMRITGQNQEDAKVVVSIDGRNGSRTGHYQTRLTGRQYDQDPTQMIKAMALGFGSVMVEIDQDYPQRLLQKLIESGRQPN